MTTTRVRYLTVDIGTQSVRAGIVAEDAAILGVGRAPVQTAYPHPGWAEQSPEEWLSAMRTAISTALAEAHVTPGEIDAISLDATGSTVVLVDAQDRAVNAMMWLDSRAAAEAQEITTAIVSGLQSGSLRPRAATQWVDENAGPTSEWMPAKALWVKRHRPEQWQSTVRVMEATDWLVYQLTGQWIAGTGVAAARAFHHARDGWPEDLFAAIGLDDLLPRLPDRVCAPGTLAGAVTTAAAERLPLRAGTPVAVGMADSTAAYLGTGAVGLGEFGLVTGSSHLLVGQCDETLHGPGLVGPLADTAFAGAYFVSTGQPATGTMLRWLQRLLGESDTDFHEKYDALAREIPIGSDGVTVVDHWQGARTPFADSAARGAISGLSLAHTGAHIYRAMLESIACGTALIADTLRHGGAQIDRIAVTGGASRSSLWMQLTADVLGLPLTTTASAEAALIGNAVNAAVAVGAMTTIQEGARQMARNSGATYEPDLAAHAAYREVRDNYAALYQALRQARNATH